MPRAWKRNGCGSKLGMRRPSPCGVVGDPPLRPRNSYETSRTCVLCCKTSMRRPDPHRCARWRRKQALPRSTAHRIIKKQAMPHSLKQFQAFLRACEVPDIERSAWEAAWSRAWRHEKQESDSLLSEAVSIHPVGWSQGESVSLIPAGRYRRDSAAGRVITGRAGRSRGPSAQQEPVLVPARVVTDIEARYVASRRRSKRSVRPDWEDRQLTLPGIQTKGPRASHFSSEDSRQQMSIPVGPSDP